MEEFKILECQFEKPKYSIVIPTFKRSDMLKKAVDAALGQKNIYTYEVLVMDNNPERDDATEALMMEYKENPKVSYYKNYKNLGSTGNWNKMFKMAKGDYIITCHDDDLLMPFYLEVMECFIESTNKRFGIVVPMLYYSKDHILPDIQIPTTNFVNYYLFKPQYMILSQIGLPTGILVKRSVFFKAGQYNRAYYPSDDVEFLFRALKISRGAFLCLNLALYYISGTNTTKSVFTRHVNIVKELHQMYHNNVTLGWKLVNGICYRSQIVRDMLWHDNFFNHDELNAALRKETGLSENAFLDRLSVKINGYLLHIIIKRHRKSFSLRLS